MAKSYATCATEGCTNTILFIEQNRKLADRKAAWAESEGFICSDCQEKQRQAENSKAAEQNQAAGRPTLIGSDKQIAWAEKIRAEKLETVRQAKSGELDTMYFDAYFGGSYQAIAIDDPQIDYSIELLTSQTSASWWIDHRDTKVGITLKELFTKHPPQASVSADEQAVIDDIKTESTVRPENPISETIAEISAHETSIQVKFPEKREDFRLLMRKHSFSWMSDRWQRNLNTRAGEPADRAAEIGHILLGSGFVIRIYDDAIRQSAISGKFEHEQTRWITVYISGKEQGRLCIHWGRDEDYYKAAKRLPTARYAKPDISVAIEQYEEVLDFAELNSFAISPKARSAIEAAKAARESALVVHVELAPTKKHGDDGKPMALDVPADVEIDDALRD